MSIDPDAIVTVRLTTTVSKDYTVAELATHLHRELRHVSAEIDNGDYADVLEGYAAWDTVKGGDIREEIWELTVN